MANDGSGLTILPIPAELSPVILEEETRISLIIPPTSLPGSYTLRAFNSQEYSELIGAVTFSEAPPNSKAVIVAGSGPYPGNSLWGDTKTIADYAYNALLYQGYTRENIYYISAENRDVDGDGELNDIDAECSYETMVHALIKWVNDPENPADELLVFMTGHGNKGTFTLDTSASGELKAETLDRWLDAIQQTLSGRVIVVYDGCYSGSFLPVLTPIERRRRHLVASSMDNERAVSTESGKHSFGFHFWASVYAGGDLDDSFDYAADMMAGFQTAMLDSDGDGTGPTKNDRLYANHTRIGRAYRPMSDMPVINAASVNGEPDILTLTGTSSATITAGDINEAGGLARVWAVIKPPVMEGSDDLDAPIQSIPEVELTDPDGDGSYEGAYDDFTIAGDYAVNIYAKNFNGNYSLPKRLTVIRTDGDIAVDFTASATSGPAALTVNFRGICDSDITQWKWQFGDGDTSAEQYTTHTYTQPGIYTVTLEAAGSNGSDSRTRTDLITVTPKHHRPRRYTRHRRPQRFERRQRHGHSRRHGPRNRNRRRRQFHPGTRRRHRRRKLHAEIPSPRHGRNDPARHPVRRQKRQPRRHPNKPRRRRLRPGYSG